MSGERETAVVEAEAARRSWQSTEAGAEPLPGLHARLVQVFVSPGELFEALARRPAWIGALVVVTLLSVVGALLLPVELLRQAMEAQIPADADPAQMDQVLGVARMWTIGVSLVGPALMVAVIAGLLLVIYNVLLGGEATYRQLFAATAHAFVILSAGSLLVLGLAVAREDMNVALALHLLVPGLEEGGYLYRLLHGLNVFGLWTAAVLGIAVSRIYPRRRAGAAAAVIIGLYVASKAVTALIGTMMA